MFKVMFGPTPGWIKDVQKNGRLAKALILSDPSELLKGVGGYEGRDGWVDVRAQIETVVDGQFEAKVQCRLSTSLAVKPGLRVNVKYDPGHKEHVLLTDDFNTLMSYRIKT
jgi:hypothetical protein